MWGYSSLLWHFFNDSWGEWLLLLAFTKNKIKITFKVHLSFFCHFQCAFITFFNTSTFYFQKKSSKVFNNYLMLNLTCGYIIMWNESYDYFYFIFIYLNGFKVKTLTCVNFKSKSSTPWCTCGLFFKDFQNVLGPNSNFYMIMCKCFYTYVGFYKPIQVWKPNLGFTW